MDKVCNKCEKMLPLSSFDKTGTNNQYYRNICKVCRQARERERIKRLPKHLVEERKARKREYMKKYHLKNKEEISRKHKIYYPQYYKKNKARIAERTRQWYKSLKVEVLNAYGGTTCTCCGENEILFLSLDHVNNNGAESRRKKLGDSRCAGYHYYAWLKRHGFPNKEDYQVLCMNCQFGKAHNNGVCPHKQLSENAKKE